MNQAIQFPDRESWNDDLKAICFPVLVNGLQQMCCISAEQVMRRYGGGDPEQWLSLFRLHRWDLEDEFEKMVRDEEYDSQGYFSLS
ncbi:hypothetical protein BIY26_18230 [Brenneria goodwinii]|uniref:Uncharacterized protein n=1 Tax=Brenneria goodwinii TaxID=1109412 RepID=A0A0G4JUR7_9GAMM|nr:DUF1488 domain-containing protein [Brenneria goodwinii]ATA26419.1 hypothetical protein AWC36_21165 [Brenneria goodwinii]MCG8158252.1 DUF1488 domain-containing protein [Brenneria goodwinii]MCG8162572.1 DUF1488 domain-containing protein [Brenneria goodwinii]MCG8167302.1 DUF1488 domain-containing protein [Brenneria goodwinii]MCG8171862.1 DUF1488 domain-containing protein [Brenneria goodwinii]